MFTNCVFPPELDDKQLLAYLDNPDGNLETARHLEKCPYCRERADVLDRFQKHLTTQLYRITCPTPLELGEFHMRLVPASQRLIIARHVRECPHCEQEISQLEGFMGGSFPRTTTLETMKVLIARLVGGGSQMETAQALPALRGEAKNLPIFEADGIVISLDVQPGLNGEIAMLGQMAADHQDRWTGAAVELKQPYLTSLHAMIDDLGAFTFDSVYPGSIQMIITSQDGTVIQTEEVFIGT